MGVQPVGTGGERAGTRGAALLGLLAVLTSGCEVEPSPAMMDAGPVVRDGANPEEVVGSSDAAAPSDDQQFELAFDSDPLSCGYSLRRCPNGVYPGQEPFCERGVCGIRCRAGLAACPGACIDLATARDSCGSCGHACPSDQTCVDGACASCPAGRAYCDVHDRNLSGCPNDLLTELDNCGACGVRCPPLVHGTVRCEAGGCVRSCEIGWADCNGVANDGCETELRSNRQACGACGTSCAAGSLCREGRCVVELIEELPASRPIAPISHAVTDRVRPTFRWALPYSSIAVGVRLELCADRRCERRLQTLDVTGSEHQLRDPLPAGAAFWRVTTRTATALGPSVSPTWVLYVEPSACPRSPFAIRADDFDGDALPDVAVRREREVSITYSSGIPSSSYALLPDGCVDTGAGWPTCSMSTLRSAGGVGDVTGDGYGDFLLETQGGYNRGTMRFSSISATPSVGGPEGLTPGGGFGAGISAEGGASFLLGGAGDIDRDGYGDLFYRWSSGLGGPGDRGATFTSRAGADWTVPDGCGGDDFIYAGDVNGDAIVDVVVFQCPSSTFRSSVLSLGDPVRRRFGPSQRLPACEALGVPAYAVNAWGLNDVNCDGYGDVISIDGDRQFALLGGPDGLSPSRCVSLPLP